MTEFDATPVEWSNISSNRDRPLAVFDNPLHGPNQTVGIENHVCVGTQHIRVAGGVDACIERVCSTAVLLVDDRDLHASTAAVDGPNWSCVDIGPVWDASSLEMKRLDQSRERVISRPVIDDEL